jgi:acetylornithine deacetylase/succinyl-diaminopimelate desuccinylase-like protein
MRSELTGLPEWFDDLAELLRIPSVSADSSHADDVLRAGDFIRDLIRRAGGDADWNDERSLVTGEIPPSVKGRAPTVLLYGHFDVQPPDPVALWTTPPFVPTVRDGGLYARGVVDDKGQLFTLLKAAQQLAERGELPVRLRIVCDGEEEIGGHAAGDFRANEDADACLVFDTALSVSGIPTFIIGNADWSTSASPSVPARPIFIRDYTEE